MFLTELCQTLERMKVSYAVIGGYAVALHGAVRSTVDIDLAIPLNLEAFMAAESAFTELGLHPREPWSAREIFESKDRLVRNGTHTWSFYHPIYFTRQVDILLTETVSDLQTETMDVEGVAVQVASIPSLIQMKNKSGRPQDFEDIKALEKLAMRVA